MQVADVSNYAGSILKKSASDLTCHAEIFGAFQEAADLCTRHLKAQHLGTWTLALQWRAEQMQTL